VLGLSEKLVADRQRRQRSAQSVTAGVIDQATGLAYAIAKVRTAEFGDEAAEVYKDEQAAEVYKLVERLSHSEIQQVAYVLLMENIGLDV
jgi:hypothetical protein